MDTYQQVRILRQHLMRRSKTPEADARDNILDMMRERSLTQTELAEKMGVTRQAVSLLCAGEHVLIAKSLIPLSHALDCSIVDLLKVRNPKNDPDVDEVTLTLKMPVELLKELIREGLITNG